MQNSPWWLYALKALCAGFYDAHLTDLRHPAELESCVYHRQIPTDYLWVNIGKENSKECVGFCWSFLTKNSYMEQVDLI